MKSEIYKLQGLRVSSVKCQSQQERRKVNLPSGGAILSPCFKIPRKDTIRQARLKVSCILTDEISRSRSMPKEKPFAVTKGFRARAPPRLGLRLPVEENISRSQSWMEWLNLPFNTGTAIL